MSDPDTKKLQMQLDALAVATLCGQLAVVQARHVPTGRSVGILAIKRGEGGEMVGVIPVAVMLGEDVSEYKPIGDDGEVIDHQVNKLPEDAPENRAASTFSPTWGQV